MQSSLKDIHHDAGAILAPPNTPSVSHSHKVSIRDAEQFLRRSCSAHAMSCLQAYEHPVGAISFSNLLAVPERDPHDCGSSPEEGKGRTSSRESNSHAASGEGLSLTMSTTCAYLCNHHACNMTHGMASMRHEEACGCHAVMQTHAWS